MLLMPDPFDPNILDFGFDHEHRIYAPNCEDYAVVDDIDYWYFSRWAWNFKSCRAKKNYMRRAMNVRENKTLVKTVSVYLHVEIMKRTGIQPPTVYHTIVDHRNGDETDCRRKNLRWATPRMNNINRHGSHPHDLLEG